MCVPLSHKKYDLTILQSEPNATDYDEDDDSFCNNHHHHLVTLNLFDSQHKQRLQLKCYNCSVANQL